MEDIPLKYKEHEGLIVGQIKITAFSYILLAPLGTDWRNAELKLNDIYHKCARPIQPCTPDTKPDDVTRAW